MLSSTIIEDLSYYAYSIFELPIALARLHIVEIILALLRPHILVVHKEARTFIQREPSTKEGEEGFQGVGWPTECGLTGRPSPVFLSRGPIEKEWKKERRKRSREREKDDRGRERKRKQERERVQWWTEEDADTRLAQPLLAL